MGVRLFLLYYLLYQMIITASLGEVTLPFSDLIETVTPVTPNPLSFSPISSFIEVPVTESPLLWGDYDIMPELFSPYVEGTVRDYISPIALTSSSRPLPVPKINKLSMSDVILPNGLETFSAPKIRPLPIIPNYNSDIFLPYQNPYMSSPQRISNTLLNYPLSDMYFSPNKYLSPCISALPNVNLKSRNVMDSLYPVPIFPNSIFEATYPSMPDFTYNSPYIYRNSLSTLGSLNPLPYPLYYKSMYLPRVSTPDMSLNYSPTSYLRQGNLRFASAYPSLEKNTLEYVSTYLNPIKTADILDIYNNERIPKIPSTGPFVKSPWHANYGPASIVFESKIVKPTSQIPFTLPKVSRPPLSPLALDTICYPSELDQKLCNFESNSFDSDDLPNFTSNIDINTDFVNNFEIPDMFPTIDKFIETISTIDTKDFTRNFLPCIDLPDVSSSKEVNIPETFTSPLIPDYSTYQLPNPLEECVLNIPEITPPAIPPQIPTGTSTDINVTPTSSLSNSSSNKVYSINGIVENITQNILSSFDSYLKSSLQLMSKKSKCEPKSSSYLNSESRPKHKLPVRMPLPPVNTVKSKSILPTISSSVEALNPSIKDSVTVLLTDAPSTKIMQDFETRTNQLSPTVLLQPKTATVSPLTSIVHFSPQLCPSYLPSPTIPSYIPSPHFMESPVVKVSSSGKHVKDIEEMIDLMLLADILRGDESFDWDDLDTLLAYLSIN